jgi:hypothetical protein
MPEALDRLLCRTIGALGEHREEGVVVHAFGQRYLIAYRKRLILGRFKWIGLGSAGTAPWWWPEEMAVGGGIGDMFELIRGLFTTPALLESAVSVLDRFLG